IIGSNRPEWTTFHVAAMSIGAAPVGIYTTSSPGEVQYIIDPAESSIVLPEDAQQWQKVAQERARLPRLRHIVMMRGAERVDDPQVMSWDDFQTRGGGVSEADVEQRLNALQPAQLGTLIYTSGTTGPPKGVMLSHHNLSWTADVPGQITT